MSVPTLRQTVSQVLVLAVAFPTALYTLGVVGWIAGIPLTPVLPGVALVVCLGVMVATQRSEISAVLAALLVFGGFVAGALALSAGIVDAFYDGYQERVRQAPAGHGMDYVHIYLVCSKA